MLLGNTRLDRYYLYSCHVPGVISLGDRASGRCVDVILQSNADHLAISGFVTSDILSRFLLSLDLSEIEEVIDFMSTSRKQFSAFTLQGQFLQ
jgi:hypothetical protein